MALTLYVAQAIALVIIRATTPNPERWDPPEWTLPALIVAALLVASLWKRFVGTGPLEAGLRALTRVARRPTGDPQAREPRVAP